MKLTFTSTPQDLAIDIVESEEYRDGEVTELIKCIDAEMQDYEFTLMLAKYFVAQLVAECAHDGEKFDMQTLLN